jgi:hypothetical protein
MYELLNIHLPMLNAENTFLEPRVISESKQKLHFVLSNLRDVLRYPKFTDLQPSSLTLTLLAQNLFLSPLSLTNLTLEVHIVLPDHTPLLTFTYPGHTPVHSLYERVRAVVSLQHPEIEEGFLDQYWLFLVFPGQISQIPLLADTP